MIEYIMNMFLTDEVIETLGNWYPRVMAVMSCVIPFTFIIGVFGLMALVIWASFRALR